MPWDLLYALDILSITHFLLSYYFRTYRHGCRIDQRISAPWGCS
jgi:hypothetical protein